MVRSLGGVRTLPADLGRVGRVLVGALILALGLTAIRVSTQDIPPQIIQITDSASGHPVPSPNVDFPQRMTRDASRVVFFTGGINGPEG